MDIELIYSKKDPRQAKARNFLRRFIRERGILARLIEMDKAVSSPTVIINGETLTERRARARQENARMYPAIDDIADALERHTWSLS